MAPRTVDVSETLEILQRHITGALCQAAWEEVRDTERQREWTLEMLVRFWASVTVDPPPSLSHALAAAGTGSRYPAPKTSSQAFFARCQDLSWEFFEAVFRRFVSSIADEARPVFARELQAVRRRFTSIQVVDGSNLDAIARRLKVVWRERAQVLPGSIQAFYDLCTGCLSQLVFDPDVSGSEFVRATEALDSVARNTLLVGDPLYGVPRWFAALSRRGLLGVSRLHGACSIERRRLLGSSALNEGLLEDWEVVVGSGQTVEPQPLRLIVWKKGRKRLSLLTSVLDPAILSAPEALTLYRDRWRVERLFSDLKEVLKLRRFYGANTNAVGMQVFAAAMVHTALRVAQGRIAQAAKVEPEAIATKRLFPFVTAAACLQTGIECGYELTRRANPGVELARPDLRKAPAMRARLADLLVEKRTEKRRKWRSPLQAWRQLAPRRRRRLGR
jgi:hypothetical protein